MALEGEGVELKIFESKNKSFHMKSYIFVRDDESENIYEGCAFIGSNNISKSALTDAHEWCLRYDYKKPDESFEAEQFRMIRKSFDQIFHHSSSAVHLTDQWITNYNRVRQAPVFKAVPDDGWVDESEFTPNSVQEEALLALRSTREEGFTSGLVVLATGMGKTWLSAFDAQQIDAKRVLFVAHREEILVQALNTYAKLWPEKSSGFYGGTIKQKDKEMLFASVQTLGKKIHLHQFHPDDFDYIVVDEFHHASAQTYRNIIEYFQPKFLLGITATPERSDQADILTLCANNLVFERNLVNGIENKILVPFHYYAVWDEFVDYAQIPWRHGRFDPEAANAQFATKKRAHHIFSQWQKHQQSRTLAFCVSQKHADFMAEAFNRYFTDAHLKAVSVHSTSAIRRSEALSLLDRGEIQVIFSVDLFNEGTDLPSIDTILMLRPTESNIVFLQQLGRGLRLNTYKTHLVVIDFIGNHNSFLNKIDVMGEPQSQEKSVTEKAQLTVEPKLADGCFVNIDPRITDFWQALMKRMKHSAEEDYQMLSVRLGHRPTLTEFYREGYDVTKLNKQHKSWFGLVAKQDADDEMRAIISDHHDFLLNAVQSMTMSKSFKAILLEAFLALDGFRYPPTIKSLSERSWHTLFKYPQLMKTELPKNIQGLKAVDNAWVNYWKRNPVSAFTKGENAWFIVKDGHFSANFSVHKEAINTLKVLVQELVDFRLAQYVDRNQVRKNIEALDALEANDSKIVALPYYPNIKIACGHFKLGRDDTCEMMNVELYNVDPSKHFLARASGNSMNGGKHPIHDGDLLLLETLSSDRAGSITGNTLVIETQDTAGDNQYLLRVVEKREGVYWLRANNPDYAPIPVDEGFRTLARLKQIVSE